jgi:hypothetical protein
MFFLEQTVGQYRGAKALNMNTQALSFWAIVNLIWASLSFYASTVEPYNYKDDETVFDWDWDLVFWICTGVTVGLNTLKLFTAEVVPKEAGSTEEKGQLAPTDDSATGA